MRRKLLAILVIMVMLCTPAAAFADWGPGKSYIGGDIIWYDQVIDQLYEMAEICGDIEVYTLEETFGAGRTSESGRPLYYAKAGSGDKVVWFQAQIHGNERLTTIGLMEWLWEYAQDAGYRASLADLTIYAIPIYNPDGHMLSQRGTDVYNEAGVRTNANWDLNRDWKVNADVNMSLTPLNNPPAGFVAKESQNWYELFAAVQADWGVDLHHQGTVSFTPSNTAEHGTGARAATMSVGVAMSIDGPTLPRMLDGKFNREMKQMYSYTYQDIKDDVRALFYPFWAEGYTSAANMAAGTNYSDNTKKWYPINMYSNIEIFGGVTSGMTLGLNYNGLNPYHWAAPHIFFESEQQHSLTQARQPLTERWYNIGMQNYYAVKSVCKAVQTGDYLLEDPEGYYLVPYSGTRPTQSPSSRDYDVALAAAIDFSYLEPKFIEASGLDAYVKKLSGNKNDLTITVYEKWSDKSIRPVVKTFSINNNAAGTYDVDGYKVYVDTKGNDQIRAIYFVD